MEPSGTLWPNGEFSIGYSPCGGLEREITHSEDVHQRLSSLGLALGPNYHKEEDKGEPPRGTGGMTAYGKRLLRNSVERLEYVYGTRNMSFATLTLPALTFEEHWHVSTNWGEILRIFYQKFRRLLKDKGLPLHYAGCTELQPKRTEAAQVPALHIHFVFVGRKRGHTQWAILPSELREVWASVLELYLWNTYEWNACENLQGIRKSAASYLAKYVAKSTNIDTKIRMDGTGWSLPSSWYNISSGLKRHILDNVRVDSALIDSMERSCIDGSIEAHCEYFYSGIIDEMQGTGPHYFVGKLKPEAMLDLVKYWRELKLNPD